MKEDITKAELMEFVNGGERLEGAILEALEKLKGDMKSGTCKEYVSHIAREVKQAFAEVMPGARWKLLEIMQAEGYESGDEDYSWITDLDLHQYGRELNITGYENLGIIPLERLKGELKRLNARVDELEKKRVKKQVKSQEQEEPKDSCAVYV